MSKLSQDAQSLLDTHDQPAVIIDQNYQIVSANHAYCKTYGITLDQIIGQHCHKVSHRCDVPCHQNGEQCPHKEVFSTHAPFEVLHTHYDWQNVPEHVRIKAYPVRGANGEMFLAETIHRLAPRADLDCDEMRMIGKAPAFIACIENLGMAAKSDIPVVIFGESGVGKELAAQYIHKQSSRAKRAYVTLNCAAIPEALFESELFGHERGAFTGCVGTKQGLFELASDGTLFLDEIAELPMSMQAKLLRVLDSGEYRRVGGTQPMKTSARILAATNRNLLSLTQQERFRQDLYYRLAGIKITLPPLRERRIDIAPMAQALVKRLCTPDREPPGFTQEALDRLTNHDFPGNVRELKNVLQQAMAHCTSGGIIEVNDIVFDHATRKQSVGQSGAPLGFTDRRRTESDVVAPVGYYTERARKGPGNGSGSSGGSASIADVEARHIAQLLTQHDGNRRVVAGILGISERTLYRKLNRYQMKGDGAEAGSALN